MEQYARRKGRGHQWDKLKRLTSREQEVEKNQSTFSHICCMNNACPTHKQFLLDVDTEPFVYLTPLYSLNCVACEPDCSAYPFEL